MMSNDNENNQIDVFQANKELQASFDYGQLSPEIAADAKTTATRIKTRLSNTVFETGRDLLDMKTKLQHGQFEAWVENEVGISARTAQKAMSVVKNLGDKSEYYSHLGASILYAIGHENIHYHVKWRTEEAIEAGEKITLKDVKEWEKEAAELDRIADDIRARNKKIAESVNDIQKSLDNVKTVFLDSQMESPEKQFREWANEVLAKHAQFYRFFYKDDPIENGDNLDYFNRFKKDALQWAA